MPVYQARNGRLNQGDLFEEVPFVHRLGGEQYEIRRMTGMVTAHDCDCDKYFSAIKKGVRGPIVETFPISVAPVHAPELLTGGQSGDARAGRIVRYFHLPAEGELPEQLADLYWDQPVPAPTLLDLRRAASLSDEWRTRLKVALMALRTRRDLEPPLRGTP